MAVFPISNRRQRSAILIILYLFVLYIFPPPARTEDRSKRYDPTTLVFPSFLHTYGIRKATRLHLALFTQNKVQFDDPQGLAVVRLQAWEDTTTTKDDDEVTVYGVNSGQHCIIFNTSMKSIGIYGLKETGEQRLSRPRGIAANAKGDVYVADTGNHRLVHLFNPGHGLLFKQSVGQRGAAKGQFDGPRGVALDSQGRVYVTDHGNHRVQVFAADLKFLYSWGEAGHKAGQLLAPDGIAVTDRKEFWSYYREDFVVVIDGNHDRIQQFDLQGRWLKQITAAEFGHPNCFLAYITLDYYNNIYVTDTKNHCVHKFDHQLNYLTSYGRYGDGDKEFIEPRGITNYRRFGQMFVAEKWGAQYFWIGT
ncbi:MAG: NHL repeat-containing protein, partial [candidate division KSB1 bacterium]|nr:NHL repeat-containing protein [candidate division KSB1 bacterium]